MTNFIEVVKQSVFQNADLAKREKELLVAFILGCAGLIIFTVAVGLWLAIGIVMAIIALVVTIWKPNFAVFAVAIYTPFEPFALKFVPDYLYVLARYFPEFIIYVLIGVVITRLIVGKIKFQPTPIDLPFVLFIAVAITSVALNSVPLVAGSLGIRQIIRFILLFFVTVNLSPEKKEIKTFVWIMFGVVIFESLLGILQSVIGGPLDEFLIPSEVRYFESIQLTAGTSQFWSPGTRVFATLGRFDQLGTFLSFFLLIAVGLWYTHRKSVFTHRLAIVVALALPTLVLTLSRASWFGFALGLFVIGAILMKDSRVKLLFIAVAVFAVAYLAYSGIAVRYLVDHPDQTVVERFFESFSYERWRGEYYGYGRLYWIVHTVKTVVPSSPVFGVGPGLYGGGAVAALGNARVYQELNLPFGVYGTEGYIDNNWFSLWGETGTLGLAFYLWMYFSVGYMSLKVFAKSRDSFTRGLALGLIGCLFAVALQAFLATYLEVRTLALYLWLFAGIIYVLGRREGVIETERQIR